MALRETRKKMQRSVLFMAECVNQKSALHELTLLKNTVDSIIKLLAEKLNSLEESDAPDTEKIIQATNQADSKAIYENKLLHG